MNRRSFAAASAALALVPMGAMAACDDTDEANKALVKRFIDEVLNGGNVDLLDEFASPDYQPSDPTFAPGVEAWRARLKDRRDSYMRDMPDSRHAIDDMFAADGKVAVRGTLQGTTGAGKVLNALALDTYHLSGGKITTIWSVIDYEAVLRALYG